MTKEERTLEEHKQVDLLLQELDKLHPGWEDMNVEDFKVYWDFFWEFGYVPL